MEPGKNYLVHAGDWHTFVGEFVEQTTPLLYGFRLVSKVDDTNNGDNWHELVGDVGEARDEATFIDYPQGDELYELPVSIIAMPWVGQLPHKLAKQAEAV